MPSLRKPVTPDKALLRLADLCATAERCRHELQQKLRTWGIAPGDAERILQKLEEQKFVDDARFTRAFVHDRITLQKRGRMTVRRDLMLKHIPRDIIDEALDAVDEDEYRANLRAVLRAKLRSLGPRPTPLPRDIRLKLARHAASRGYEAGLIFQALDMSEDEDSFAADAMP